MTPPIVTPPTETPPAETPPTAATPSFRLIRRGAGVVLFAALSFGFWMAFDERYLAHRECIDNLVNSSCIGPDGAHYTPGGMFWVVPSAGFALLALRAAYTLWRTLQAYAQSKARKQNGP